MHPSQLCVAALGRSQIRLTSENLALFWRHLKQWQKDLLSKWLTFYRKVKSLPSQGFFLFQKFLSYSCAFSFSHKLYSWSKAGQWICRLMLGKLKYVYIIPVRGRHRAAGVVTAWLPEGRGQGAVRLFLPISEHGAQRFCRFAIIFCCFYIKYSYM